MQKTYWLAKSILTENERIFYNILAPALSKEHILLCKVRMEDVIKVDFNLEKRDYSEFCRARGKMRGRHFDFVICDAQTQQIQRVIELDGWTHQKAKEAEADKFKDEVCAEAVVQLVRIDYNDLNFPDRIFEKINS